ncbi:MAG: hypothetical protein H6685_13290 [Deltaproteobacteria bacterium]|nr:hypothetical protein [Deltaproteobacteria bacterium]
MTGKRIDVDSGRERRPIGGVLLNLGLAFLFLAVVGAIAGEYYLRFMADNTAPPNTWGYHDIEPTLTDEDGARVMILGDSFVEGIAVPVEDTIGRRLESYLDAKTDARVFALGKPGAGQADELDMLDAHITQVRPGLVLVYFLPANDVMNNSALLEMKETKPRYFLSYGKLERMPPQPPPHEARSKLRIVDFVRQRWDRRNAEKLRIEAGQGVPLDFRVYQQPLTEVWTEAWIVTELLLTEIREHARMMGARFGIVVIPDRHELDDQFVQKLAAEYPAASRLEWDTRSPARRLEEYAKLENIPVLDLYPVFKKANPDVVFLPDGHWSAAGHELAAQASVDFVAQLLKAPAPESTFKTSSPDKKSKLAAAGPPLRGPGGE